MRDEERRVLCLVVISCAGLVLLGTATCQQHQVSGQPMVAPEAPVDILIRPQIPPVGLSGQQMISYVDKPIIQVEAQPVVREKKCVPSLNISALLHGPPKTNVSKDGDVKFANGTETKSATSNDELNNNEPPKQPILSFPIEDINMPIAQTGGSVHSAMKMLSSFSSHLANLGQEEEEQENQGGLRGEEEEEEEDEGQENLVKFKSNRLTVEGLNLSMLNIHLYPDSDPKFALGITIRNTTLTGKFIYNGPAILTETRLAAHYRMSIDNIYLTAASNLTKSPIGSQYSGLNNTKQRYALRTENFKMNISNLGYITIEILDSHDASKPTVNYLLRMLQRILQKTIKRTYYSFENYIRQTLELESRRSIDCELTRFSPLLASSSTSDDDENSSTSTTNSPSSQLKNNQQEDLARIINQEIRDSHFDSVPLPNYDHHQSILGTQAKVHLHNGSLSGLDHLQLTGETKIKLQDQHLLVNASIGWFNLRPYYNWEMYLGANASAPTTKGFVAFNIKHIDFDAVITKGLRPQTKIVVDQLEIRQLDSPKMDIGGIPGMNRLTRGIVNFFMGRLKQRLSSSLQPVLKSQLEKSLNKMSIFIG